MKFTVNKQDLLKAINISKSISDRKTIIPVLSNILIRTVNKGTIQCVATDIKLTLIANIPASVTEEGGFATDAKNFYEIVKSMPNATDDNTVPLVFSTTSNGRLEVKSRKSKFTLVGVPDIEFPSIVDLKEVELATFSSKKLIEAIDKTIFSASKDESRLYLNGIQVDPYDKCLVFVSADGARLSKFEMNVEEKLNINAPLMIPRKSALEIKKLLTGSEVCNIGVFKSYFVVNVDSANLLVKLIETEFIKYNRYIPANNDISIVVNKEDILGLMKRMSILSGHLRVNISKGKMCTTNESEQFGDSSEELDIEYNGDSVTILLNPSYLTEAIESTSGENIVFLISKDSGACTVQSVEKDHTNVLMLMVDNKDD